MSRISRDTDRRLLFRGWSRMCLHAASLNGTEGALAAAAAAARAARVKALEIESAAAIENTELRGKAATATSWGEDATRRAVEAPQQATESKATTEDIRTAVLESRNRAIRFLVSSSYAVRAELGANARETVSGSKPLSYVTFSRTSS